MVEIRTIRSDEADEFLRLVCTVFDLHFEQARHIFRKEPYYDLNSKWALFEDSRIVSTLTTVPLRFKDRCGVGIAGVATHKDRRGNGFAEQLLRTATKSHPFALLFATDPRLYERMGYVKLDDVIRATLPHDPKARWAPLSERRVQERYEAWAAEDPRRLRRDAKRWDYWAFSMKTPLVNEPHYCVLEGNRVRELSGWRDPIPSSSDVEWIGLRTMTEMLKLPIRNESVVMSLLGIGIDFVPQMFMTDQF